MTSPDPALAGAFAATTYRVWLAGDVYDLHLGRGQPGFDAALAVLGVREWAVITACNPGARMLATDNAERTVRLLERLAELGRRAVPACNLADAGDWPAEPGACVLEIDERAACLLAREFGQLAVVCGRCGERPRLVWTDVAEGAAGSGKTV